MKKLMVILSVALSLGAFAEDLPTGVSFESFSEGAFDFSKKDDNTAVSSAGDLAYWITNGVNEAEIKAESGRYTQSHAPAQWAEEGSNSMYLHLDGGLVYRTAKTCIDGSGDRRTIAEQAANATVSFDDKANGIYFDSMVKFTAFEELQTKLDDDAAKLAVYAYAPEAGGTTNLVISGGYGSDRTFTNYVSSNVVDLATWHRLTVRAFNAGGGSSDVAAFLVYLDGVLVTNADWNCGFTAGDLSALGAKYIAGGEYGNALIPSLNNSLNICAMGFNGSGDVDDLSITSTKPTFIEESTQYTVAWNEGVKSLKIDTAEAFDVPSASGTTNLTLAADKSEVTIIATYSNNYVRGTWTATGATAPADPANKFTGVKGGSILNINAMLPKYEVGGKYYDSISDAMKDVVDGSVIKLMADDSNVQIVTTDGFDGTITIDLAGKTLAGKAGVDMDVISGGENTSLIITNSTVTLGKVVPVDGNYAVYTGNNLTIYNGIFDGMVGIDDEGSGTITVTGGEYLDAGAKGVVESFYLVYDKVVSADKVEYIGNDYFKVGEPPAPTSKPFVIIIGSTTNGYDKLDEAIAAFKGAEGEKVAFMKEYNRTDDLTIDKGLVLDINGQTVVMSNIAVTAGTTKLINSKSTAPALTGSTGLFVPNGEIAVSDDATIDLSALPFGETYGGVNGPGSLTLAAGATAKFYKWNVPMVDSANWMFYNYPAFFTGSMIPVDGIVMIGDKTWTGAADRFVIADEVATATVAAYHNVGGDTSAFTHIESFTSVDDAINATTDNKVTVTSSASASAQKADLEITINSGATLTITASSVAENVTFKGEGSLVRSGALDVAASLDLASLAYTQTAGCTGGFNIKDGGIVYMPIGVTYPNATLAVNTESTVDGAKIVVGGATGTTYTYGGGAWIEGEYQPVAKIGTVGYASLAAALSAAQADETVTLLANVSLDATLVVDKVITLDLGKKTVTMASTAFMGVNVTAAATIKNGKFVSSRTTDGGYAIVTDPAIAATYEDLEIDGAHYRFVFACDSVGGTQIQAEFDAAPTAKVTCKNVDVKGNGTLFYAQHTLLDLDADCSATAEGTASTAESYHAAIYSALNATITVAGGAYSNANALVVGNLGGKIVINDGTLTGDIKSYMYKDDKRFTNNVATVEITGGTIKGGFTFADDQAGTCTKDEVKWNITGGSFSSDPSDYVADGYKAIYDSMQNLYNVVQAYEITDGTAKGGSLSFDPASPAAEGEVVTVTPSAKPGYTFKEGSITSDDVTITGNTFTMPAQSVEVSAVFTANVYTVTAATGLTGGTVSVDKSSATVEDTITVTATPATGYTLSTITVNGSSITGNTFNMPAANAVVSAVFTLNQYTVSYTTNTVAYSSESVAHGSSPAEIPELTGGKWDVDPDGAVITCNTNFNYTISGKVYPGDMPDDPTIKGKYDTWHAKYPTADPTETSTKEAFLLDCNPANLADAKAAFKIISITQDGENWIVKVTGGVGDDEAYGNGIVTIENTTITGAASGAEFYKAILDYEHHDAE